MRLTCRRAAIFGFVLWLLCASFAWADWRVVPEVRVTGGDETDILVDPAVTGAIVPGGAFVEITPAISLRTWADGEALLSFGTFATLQRFLNDDNRLLYAQTVWGDLYQTFGESLRGRLSAVVDYFDDSERETVRRFNEGLEAGLSVVGARWNAELWAGANARQYPNLTTIENMRTKVTYTETAWSGGATLRAAPAGRIALTGVGSVQSTSARDPFYDSQSWTATGSADTRLVSSLFLTLSGSYQDRTFTERLPGEDHDTYWQVGAGLRYRVAEGWMASVRYGYSLYTWPDGTEDDSQRLAVGLAYAWGRREVPPPPRAKLTQVGGESGAAVQRPGEAGTVRLRVQAPGARIVTVAGSFNGWEAAPLKPAGGGWWEIDVALDPGSYEYVYVIDGVATTPPEAAVTVDDGFGGRNGLLEVLPPE